MTVAAFATSSGTLVIATESFIDVNEAGLFTYHFDPVNLVAGDYLEARVYQMVLTGGTARVLYLETFQGVQPAGGMIQVALPVGNELTDSQALRFSLLQVLGTGRAVPRKVLKYT